MQKIKSYPRTKPMHAETACIITYESIANSIDKGEIISLINRMKYYRTRQNTETINVDKLLSKTNLNSNDLLALENQNAIYDSRTNSFRLYNIVEEEIFDKWTYDMSLKQKFNLEGVLSLYDDPILFDNVFLWREHNIISYEHQVLFNLEYNIQYIDDAKLADMHNAIIRMDLLKQIKGLCNDLPIADLYTVLTNCKTLAVLRGDNINA